MLYAGVLKTSSDADTAGAVVGALAGVAYGIDAVLQRSGKCWNIVYLISWADLLVAR
jgi:hypothetical protein